MARQSDPRQQLILRIDLEGTERETWREITIDGTAGLDELADAILIAFGWTGTGTHQFGSAWPARALALVGSRPDADGWGDELSSHGRDERLRPLVRRVRRPDAWREYHSYYSDDDDIICDHAWNVAEAVGHAGDELVFEYRQRELVDDRPVRGWRHRIRRVDSSLRPFGASTATILGGAGLVPRDLAEAAYGELGDPDELHLLEHEFDVRFGARSRSALGLESCGSSLDAAVWGASVVARRALRMDLLRLGILSSVEVDAELAERVIAPIRDILRRAAASDGVEPADLGELGDDLRELRLLRRHKGRLHTLAEVRDRALEHPLKLWSVLAARLMAAGSRRYTLTVSTQIAEFAIDLTRGEHEVRTFAFDEAHRDVISAGSGVPDFNRVLRVLVAIGLVDEDGVPIHPAAVLFAMTMLRS
ncbi:MAG TPA: hypothetical protein VF000_06660 [Agromyces sp.]|jgi:pRiA4b ORF-3-like protein